MRVFVLVIVGGGTGQAHPTPSLSAPTPWHGVYMSTLHLYTLLIRPVHRSGEAALPFTSHHAQYPLRELCEIVAISTTSSPPPLSLFGWCWGERRGGCADRKLPRGGIVEFRISLSLIQIVRLRVRVERACSDVHPHKQRVKIVKMCQLCCAVMK